MEAFLLVRVLDACYTVDKALCGFSSASSTQIQKLQSIDKLEYLSSEELIAWWEVSLCELDELIKSRESVSVSDSFRLADIVTANRTLQEALNRLVGDCWTPLREHPQVWEGLLRGVEDIERQIEKRAERLRVAAKVVEKSFEALKKRTKSGRPTEKTGTHTAEPRSPEAIDEGGHLGTLSRSDAAANT